MSDRERLAQLEELYALRERDKASTPAPKRGIFDPIPLPARSKLSDSNTVVGKIGGGLKNAFIDANDTVEGLYHAPGAIANAVAHPVQTYDALKDAAGKGLDIAKGGLQTVREISPEGQRGSAPAMDKTAYDQFAKGVSDKYGSVAKALNTTYEAPLAPAITAAQVAVPALRAVGADKLIAETAAKAGGAVRASIPKPTIAPPTVPVLKTKAQGLYKRAEQAGVVIDKQSHANFADDLTNALKGEGIDKDLHPKATAALNRVVNTTGDVSLSDLEILRKIAGDAAGTVDKADKRLARIITDHIDDFAENLQPHNIVAGNAPEAVRYLRKARATWRDAARGDTIEKAIAKAKQESGFLGVGMDGAYRKEFKKLANSERGMARFTEPQRAAIRKVAYGDGPVQAVMHSLGKLVPTSELGIASRGGGVAAAATLMGVPVTAPIVAGATGTGLAGKIASTKITAKNAARASELARGGRTVVSPARAAAVKKIEQRNARRAAWQAKQAKKP
jgi:hypothetical protein